jgi:AcrR family transcriptional regulator
MSANAAQIPMVLPRGRHGLSREVVLASQRRRLLEAMVEVSAERGYPAVRIGDVVGRAGVARRTFYEHFESKDMCFLAAYDYTAEQIIGPLSAAYNPVDDVLARAGAYVKAILDALAKRPAIARMLVTEVGAGGPAAISHRLRMHRRIAEAIVALNQRTRESGISVPAITPDRALAMVGALVELMHATIDDRGPEHLPELSVELASIVVALIVGPAR